MSKTTLNTFWTGIASPYQTLCLSSWVAHGFDVVVYSVEDTLVLPRGAQRRPAREILDLNGHIYRYSQGFGAGSPALHSNLFRYILLSRGGWWLDTDVILLTDELPSGDTFLAWEVGKRLVGNAIMRLPADSPMVHAAIEEANEMAATATWGQTGPRLITDLVKRFGLTDLVRDPSSAYPIASLEAMMFFDPACREAVEARVQSSTFVHLWNQVWRFVGIPQEMGPPVGSYLDSLFVRYGGRDRFRDHLPIDCLRLWWKHAYRRRHLVRAKKIGLNLGPNFIQDSRATPSEP